MLSVLGRGAKLCDEVDRREMLRVGGLSLFGLTLPGLLRAAEHETTRPRRVKSVILFNLLGGPSHQDMFDMKPHAPAEVRGEFQELFCSLPPCESLGDFLRCIS